MESEVAEDQGTKTLETVGLEKQLLIVSQERNLLRACLAEMKSAIARFEEAVEASGDPWVQLLGAYLDPERSYTMRRILVECMGLRWEAHGRAKMSRLRACLTSLGWRPLIVSGVTKQVRVWRFAGMMADNLGLADLDEDEIEEGPLGSDAAQKLLEFLDESKMYGSKNLLTAVFGIPPGYNRHSRERILDLARHMKSLGWKTVVRNGQRGWVKVTHDKTQTL